MGAQKCGIVGGSGGGSGRHVGCVSGEVIRAVLLSVAFPLVFSYNGNIVKEKKGPPASGQETNKFYLFLVPALQEDFTEGLPDQKQPNRRKVNGSHEPFALCRMFAILMNGKLRLFDGWVSGKPRYQPAVFIGSESRKKVRRCLTKK